jgi:hypothetical protein
VVLVVVVLLKTTQQEQETLLALLLLKVTQVARVEPEEASHSEAAVEVVHPLLV